MGPELVVAGVKCCSVRQKRTVEVGESVEPHKNMQTLASYTRDELIAFQEQDPTICGFRKFWHVKKSVLLRQGECIRIEQGLLYCVINDAQKGKAIAFAFMHERKGAPVCP